MKTLFNTAVSCKSRKPLLTLCVLLAMFTAFPTCHAQQITGNNNDFACNLLRVLNEQNEGSFVASPISVTFMLGMLNAGADGETRQQITDVMGLDGSVQSINEYCRRMILKAPRVDPSATIKIANSIVANSFLNISLIPQYDKDMQHYYMAEVDAFDFRDDNALNQINKWCYTHTDGMIPTILDRINPLAAMYLLDAIYFKANWTSKFDPSSTRQMAFTMPDGNSENRMMMHSNMKADYCSNDYYQMLYLPYGNQSYGMYILLPDRDKTTDDIIERLTAQELEIMIQNMRNCNVDILLPRFTTSSHHMLNDPLSAMGMPLAFSEEYADFPFMAQDNNLFVYQMLQRARIEVNERGTKAAAVTVAETTNRSAAPMTNHVNFHAVRPFVYFIVERNTHAIFFMGTYRGEEQ